MNGKNRRTRSCWSRGAPSYGHYRIEKPEITNNTVVPTPPLYRLPRFPNSLLNNLTSSQSVIPNYFSKYPFKNIVERFSYNSNTPYAIVDLYNSDFINGTVRIRTAGVYRLRENITFNPNPNNNFFPTKAQVDSGLYPQNMMGPYHLGFFAAITVETDNVIIDLNGYKIEQSANHNFQQRFYANIELANAPFIKDKGPANFQGAMSYKAANMVLVYNGQLLKSSHHGIHANKANNVMLYHLKIEEFEVAGVALNGTITGILSDLFIKNNKQEIEVLSTYSQARFIHKFLDRVDESVTFKGKNVETIKAALQNDLDTTFQDFKDGKTISVDYFRNDNVGYDGNVYGIVLNVNGPVVGPFLTAETLGNVPAPAGNTDIYLENIYIDNISSHPVEIIGAKNLDGGSGAYGSKMQAGPIGDILQIANSHVTKDSKYIGTSLSDSQMIIAASSMVQKGTSSISQDIIEWAENGTDISTVIPGEHNCYYVGGGDSMGHTMKGNLGLFISGGSNISGNNIQIHNIVNKGQDVGTQIITPIQPTVRSKLGASAVDILFTVCSNITFTGSSLGKPVSENKGTGTLLDENGECPTVYFVDNNSTNCVVT